MVVVRKKCRDCKVQVSAERVTEHRRDNGRSSGPAGLGLQSPTASVKFAAACTRSLPEPAVEGSPEAVGRSIRSRRRLPPAASPPAACVVHCG